MAASDLAKMELAWRCVMTQYSTFIQEQYQTHGPGLALFVLADRSSNGSNCEFNYVTKDSQNWNFLVNTLPSTKELFSIYDPQKHLMVVVTINLRGELVSQVRLFLNDNLVEVLYFKDVSS